jgi:hypothetical protein
MFDFCSHYALVKSVMQTKAKEEHKPCLGNKASMAAYAIATGNTGKASFMPAQMEVIDCV